MKNRTQESHFYESRCRAAAAMHQRMADLHRANGNTALALDFENTAKARLIAAEDIKAGANLREALDHAEWRKDQPV